MTLTIRSKTNLLRSGRHTLHKVGMANLILQQYNLGRSRNHSVCLALWNAFLAAHQLPPVQAVGDGYTPTAPARATVRNPVPTQATQLTLTLPAIVQNPIQIQQPTDDRWTATTNADSNEREAEDDVEHDEVKVDEEDDGKKTISIMERAQSASVRMTKTMISLKMISVDHLEVGFRGRQWDGSHCSHG